MDRASAWILNFDADEELARPAGYTPRRAVADRAPELAGRVLALLRPGDVVLSPELPSPLVPPAPPGIAFVGRAWCPTPRARRLLGRAGVTPAEAPPLDVLRRVNHRKFCADLGQTLPGACYVTTLAELDAAVAEPTPSGHWLLKRPFGFAGRGRRRVARGALPPDVRPWAVASLAPAPASAGGPGGPGGGLQVEPWVERRGDFSLHGHVARGGVVRLGAPCVQRCDAHGAYLGADRAGEGELEGEERRRLVEAALAAGHALAGAGYFGPFGIDAFRWEDERGGLRWNPRCEINARYTMAWAIGMGDVRPDLE
ncbi:hypothetical protein SOCE26_013580 [Sorangium cellulosum]|uniref:ATP-grasp domain-containing protein n=1 Tax=Sorangium cellulosum TaxID=56 RepID=A0A2L0EKZ4_SORCE|nr:hypothetical protein [Sorangium cellulosum]AUX39963.1 hypothetical protein SOCE26_013580 [Sorangium cellulosum]